MKKVTRYFAMFLALLVTSAIGPQLLAAGSSSSYSGDRVVFESKKTFDQVNSALESLVAKNGMMIMAQVDQGKMLTMTGLKLNAKLYLIGNPTVGKQLFEQDHGVGLYVPLRVFVFTDEKGKTYVSYDKASAQLGQFENEKVKMVAQMLDQKLEGLASMAVQ